MTDNTDAGARGAAATAGGHDGGNGRQDCMKSKVFRISLGILTAVLLFALGWGVLMPVFRAGESIIRSYTDDIDRYLRERTGLTFSYEHISPSILPRITVRNIEVKDAETGERVASIERAVLSYNLRGLLAGDAETRLTQLLLKNTVVTLSADRFTTLLNNYFARVRAAGYTVEEREGRWSARAFSFPFGVRVRNFTLDFAYDFGERRVWNNRLFVRDLDLSKNDENSVMSFSGSGSYTATFERLFGGNTLGFNFTISSRLLSPFPGSSVMLFMDDMPEADITVRTLSCLATYEHPAFSFLFSGASHPLSALISWDLEDRTVSARAQAERLDPLTVVRFRDPPAWLRIIDGASLSGTGSAVLDIRSREYNWDADVEFGLPRDILDGEQSISLAATGNNTDIQVASLSTEGKVLDASFSGSFNIPYLKPAGRLSVERLSLANGDIALDGRLIAREGDGFDILIPELRGAARGAQGATPASFTYTDLHGFASLGESTALSFSAKDADHGDFGSPSSVSVSANLATGSERYLELSVDFENFFLDTALNTALVFAGDRLASLGLTGALLDRVKRFSAPYVSNIEGYIATDFDTYTCNFPAAVFADTSHDGRALLLSFDGAGEAGGEIAVQISQADFIIGDAALQFEAGVRVDTASRQATFTSRLDFNGFPYSFNGLFVFGDWLNVSGDYGLDAAVSLRDGIDGTVRFRDFPIPLGAFILGASCDASFAVPEGGEVSVSIANLTLEELSQRLRTRPALSFSAEINGNQAVASSIVWRDTVSALEGEGYALWNINGGVFSNASVSFALESAAARSPQSVAGVAVPAVLSAAEESLAPPEASERLSVVLDVTNPFARGISREALENDFYFSAQALADSLSMRHFLRAQRDANTLTAELNASGTLSSPYIALGMRDASCFVGGADARAKADVSLVENVLSVSGGSLSWRSARAEDIALSVNFTDATGSGALALSFGEGERALACDAVLSLSDLTGTSRTSPADAASGAGLLAALLSQGGRILPDEYAIETRFSPRAHPDAPEGGGAFPAFSVTLIRSPGRFDIVTDETLGAYGELVAGGDIAFYVSEEKPFHFTLSGNIGNPAALDLSFENIALDFAPITPRVDSDFFALHGGALRGALGVTGPVSSPLFNGTITMSNLDFTLPFLSDEHFRAQSVNVDLAENEITIGDTTLVTDRSTHDINAEFVINGASVERIEASVATAPGSTLRIDSELPYGTLRGDVAVEASLLADETGNIDVEGAVRLSNADATLEIGNLRNIYRARQRGRSNRSITAALDIEMGDRVRVELNPLLRALIAPGTPISVSVDTARSLWAIRGDIVLRGGEIAYLNRNFYLRRGQLTLNEDQNGFDPVVTVRAEARERDSNGNPVTIILSAASQRVSNFNATLSSNPAKSNTEIAQILGQIVTADASGLGTFVLSGVDYVAQLVLLRRLEGALRDLFNFDIFSVRTSVLQNSIAQGLGLRERWADNSVIGNLFDNSTVYIGKYLGAVVYADAMLHWSYNGRGAAGASGAGLEWQPEFGLEFEAPFANIRWGFAPDFSGAGDGFFRSWVPGTSLTLSWNLAF